MVRDQDSGTDIEDTFDNAVESSRAKTVERRSLANALSELKRDIPGYHQRYCQEGSSIRKCTHRVLGVRDEVRGA